MPCCDKIPEEINLKGRKVLFGLIVSEFQCMVGWRRRFWARAEAEQLGRERAVEKSHSPSGDREASESKREGKDGAGVPVSPSGAPTDLTSSP